MSEPSKPTPSDRAYDSTKTTLNHLAMDSRGWFMAGWQACADDREMAPAPPQAESERTDADYAIEHAEYLATAVERYLDVRNTFDASEQDVADQDCLNDHIRAMKSGIGEFRKRAERYRRGDHGAELTSDARPAAGEVSDVWESEETQEVAPLGSQLREGERAASVCGRPLPRSVAQRE